MEITCELDPGEKRAFKEEAQALGLCSGSKSQGILGKLDGINKASRHTAVTMWAQALKWRRIRSSTNCPGNPWSSSPPVCNPSLLQTWQKQHLLQITSWPKLFNFPFTDFFTPRSLAAIRSDEGVLPPPRLVGDTQIDLLNLIGLDNDDPKIPPRNLIL